MASELEETIEAFVYPLICSYDKGDVETVKELVKEATLSRILNRVLLRSISENPILALQAYKNAAKFGIVIDISEQEINTAYLDGLVSCFCEKSAGNNKEKLMSYGLACLVEEFVGEHGLMIPRDYNTARRRNYEKVRLHKAWQGDQELEWMPKNLKESLRGAGAENIIQGAKDLLDLERFRVISDYVLERIDFLVEKLRECELMEKGLRYKYVKR